MFNPRITITPAGSKIVIHSITTAQGQRRQQTFTSTMRDMICKVFPIIELHIQLSAIKKFLQHFGFSPTSLSKLIIFQWPFATLKDSFLKLNIHGFMHIKI